jgi:hypothetical protein
MTVNRRKRRRYAAALRALAATGVTTPMMRSRAVGKCRAPTHGWWTVRRGSPFCRASCKGPAALPKKRGGRRCYL